MVNYVGGVGADHTLILSLKVLDTAVFAGACEWTCREKHQPRLLQGDLAGWIGKASWRVRSLMAVTAAVSGRTAKTCETARQLTLQSGQLSWSLQLAPDGIRSVALENHLSGRRFLLHSTDEFRLIFASGERVEIPWWDFRLSDETPVSPERERALAEGFHKVPAMSSDWSPVDNLSGGQAGRVYGGYGLVPL